MADVLDIVVDFNDVWYGHSDSGWLFYEPDRVILGQYVRVTDMNDPTLTGKAVVIQLRQYVAHLLPVSSLPGETP